MGRLSLILAVCSINDKQTNAQLKKYCAGREPCFTTAPAGRPSKQIRSLLHTAVYTESQQIFKNKQLQLVDLAFINCMEINSQYLFAMKAYKLKSVKELSKRVYKSERKGALCSLR